MIMWKMIRRRTRQNGWMGMIAAESGVKSPRYKVRWGVNLMIKNCGNSWRRAGIFSHFFAGEFLQPPPHLLHMGDLTNDYVEDEPEEDQTEWMDGDDYI